MLPSGLILYLHCCFHSIAVFTVLCSFPCGVSPDRIVVVFSFSGESGISVHVFVRVFVGSHLAGVGGEHGVFGIEENGSGQRFLICFFHVSFNLKYVIFLRLSACDEFLSVADVESAFAQFVDASSGEVKDGCVDFVAFVRHDLVDVRGGVVSKSECHASFSGECEGSGEIGSVHAE